MRQGPGPGTYILEKPQISAAQGVGLPLKQHCPTLSGHPSQL